MTVFHKPFAAQQSELFDLALSRDESGKTIRQQIIRCLTFPKPPMPITRTCVRSCSSTFESCQMIRDKRLHNNNKYIIMYIYTCKNDNNDNHALLLCYIILYHIVLNHIMSYYIILCYVILYHIVWYDMIWYDIVSYYIVLYYIVLYYTMLYHIFICIYIY